MCRQFCLRILTSWTVLAFCRTTSSGRLARLRSLRKTPADRLCYEAFSRVRIGAVQVSFSEHIARVLARLLEV